MRDVFTMGAGRSRSERAALRRPGTPEDPRLLSGVVSGIGGYGNCVGVPTVGGETQFHPGYNGNILVNAMCVGLADADKIFLSAAPAPGPAGGLLRLQDRPRRHSRRHHGLGRVRRRQRREAPTVQVGDPFAEKLLIEATLELMATGAVAAIQDMGAAGLTSSSVEMAARASSASSLTSTRCPSAKRT
jgi:phosphoribosylformylglycinamidine synthase